MKPILILIIISFLLAGCRKVSDPVSVNRFDPESEYFTGNPVRGISVKTLSQNSLQLAWKDTSSFETGYKIERTALNSGKIDTIVLGSNVNFCNFENLDIFETYKFRIGATIDRPFFRFTDSLTLKYNPYPEMVNSPVTGPVQISNNSKRCIRIISPLLDSDPDKISIFNINGEIFSPVRAKTFFRKDAASYLLSGDGRFIAFSQYDSYGYYDIDHDKMVNLQDIHVVKIAISPDSRNIILFSIDHVLTVWNIETNTRKSMDYSKYSYLGFRAVEVSPDNHYAACSDWNTIFIFDLETMSLYSSIGIPENIHEVMGFNDNSEVFFFHCYYYGLSQPVNFYSLKKKQIFYSRSSAYYKYMKYIRNGEFILAYNGGNKASLWKLVNDIPAVEIPVYFPDVRDANFLDITATSDGSIMPISYYTENVPNPFMRYRETWRVVN